MADQSSDTGANEPTDVGASQGFRGRLVAARWPVFVLPFLVYMLANTLEPSPPETPETQGEEAAGGEDPQAAVDDEIESEGDFLGIRYRHYPLVYTGKLVVTLLVLAFVWPGLRDFPPRMSFAAVGIGLVGAVLWIALCELGLEAKILTAVGLGHLVEGAARSAFNPMVEMADTPFLGYLFLAVRFSGLVVVVPLVEELIWRGFLMRFVAGSPWWEIPFGEFDGTAVAVTTVMFVAAHPFTEAFAAVSWFLLVTALMLSTRNLWDCIVAHGVTNLALGIYVVATDSWWLM